VAPAGSDAVTTVRAVFRRVEESMNEWRKSSALGRVNERAGTVPVPVPPEVFELVQRGVEIGVLTDGAFDITWAALWGLWEFRAEQPAVPAAQEIGARAALVDHRALELDPVARTLFLPRKGMKIGVGGIAKGWALDRAAEELRARGIGDFLIAAGGQVYAAGGRGDAAWRVGVRDPRGAEDDVFASLQLRDLSVSTSGDYERFFIVDGVRYHHILDPRSGMPARGLRSATVIAADATLADALSTAVMVLGPEAGLALVEGLDGVEALVVDQRARVRHSSGLAAPLRLHHPPAEGDGP
jgi:thiamine biosynthesis lipoprotein